jgi:molybdenum cofactor biosynthesis enzyme MoaA
VPPILLYSGNLNLDLALMDAVRQKIRANIAAGVDSFCAHCPYANEQHKSLPLWYLSIGITDGCNQRCIYCSAGSPAYAPSDFPLKEMVEKIIASNLGSPFMFEWAGDGEPTIYRDFAAIFSHMIENGEFGHVYTNATVFSRDIYNALAAKKVKTITSLDSGTAETFKKVKGIDAFDKVTKNLEEYHRSGSGGVRIKYIVLPENATDADFDGFCAFIERSKIPDASISISYNRFNSRDGREAVKAFRERLKSRFPGAAIDNMDYATK